MSPKHSSELAQARRKFVEAGGHTTQSFGLGRIIGQTYSLLYLSPTPLCLDDIASELSVSKASICTSVRQLERWSAVKKVWVQGDRKDYYEAETDFRAVLRKGLLTTLRKKLETAGGQIELVADSFAKAQSDGENGENAELKVLAERLEKAKNFQSKLNGLLSNPLLDHLL
jgi:DNA-binding transcriptional regulator GbsR (MarR family)